MNFSKIQPFVRYVHYLPIDQNSVYSETVPYDNRLFFTCYGNGIISVNEKKYNMSKGSLIIIPSGIKYRILSAKATYIAINFDYTSQNSDKHTPIPPTAVSAYNPDMKLEQICFNDMENFNNEVFAENQFHLENIFLKIYDEFSNKLIFYNSVVSNLLGEILLQIARLAHTNGFQKNNEIINQITDYIHENYSKKITNEIIGSTFNLHPNYISNLIKKFTGIPLHQYIMQIRVSAAVEMLMTKNYSIGEISEKCGFSDIYHFSKVFKKVTGVSPSKYN